MTTPANYPLTIRTGDTEQISLTLQNQDGSAVNIAGRTYSSQVRSRPDSSSAIATFACEVVGDGSTGQIICTLSSATTAALSPGYGVFDLQESASGVVTTLLAGNVTIVQDVTR